jgi:hypothetical protein
MGDALQQTWYAINTVLHECACKTARACIWSDGWRTSTNLVSQWPLCSTNAQAKLHVLAFDLMGDAPQQTWYAITTVLHKCTCKTACACIRFEGYHTYIRDQKQQAVFDLLGNNKQLFSCVQTNTPNARNLTRVGQNRICTPYVTVYLVIYLPKLPYIHRNTYKCMVLANPKFNPGGTTRGSSVVVTFNSGGTAKGCS